MPLLCPLWSLLAMHAPAELPLRWRAPEGCPDAARVDAELAGIVGSTIRRDVEFDADVARDGEGYRLDLITRWADGREDRRSARAASCRELTDAAVLMVAIALDPVGTSGRAREAGLVRSTRVSPARAPAAPRGRSAAASGPGREIVFGVRPAFTLDWGGLPRLAPGVSLDLSLTWRILRAELSGSYWFAQRAVVADLPKRGAWISSGSAAARICVAPVAATVTFPVCAGLEAGAVRARGIGTDLSTSEHSPWLAVVGGPTLLWAFVPRVGLAVGLDVVVPLLHPDVRTTADEPLHRAEPVILRPMVGFELRL